MIFLPEIFLSGVWIQFPLDEVELSGCQPSCVYGSFFVGLAYAPVERLLLICVNFAFNKFFLFLPWCLCVCVWVLSCCNVTKIFWFKGRQAELDEASVEMIVEDCRPFSVVEDKGFKSFKAFVNKLASTSVLPTRQALRAMVERKYKEAEQ